MSTINITGNIQKAAIIQLRSKEIVERSALSGR